MKEYALVTTHFCYKCSKIESDSLKKKLNYDGPIEDLHINFNNTFDAFHFNEIPNVGITKRKDLIYGKIFLLKNYVEKHLLNRYEYLLHIDYSDTKFSKSFVEMMEKFKKSGEEIIISTEKQSWPYIDVVNMWLDKELVDEEFKFLNSGAVLSKVKKFYEILTYLENLCLSTTIDFWDDQGVWQFYDLKIKSIPKDEKCEFFFSTALLDNSYYSIENKQIKTKFGTYPYLIHDNSSFSLNLINKI